MLTKKICQQIKKCKCRQEAKISKFQLHNFHLNWIESSEFIDVEARELYKETRQPKQAKGPQAQYFAQ